MAPLVSISTDQSFHQAIEHCTGYTVCVMRDASDLTARRQNRAIDEL
jgi:hypothetical protein